MGNAPRPCFAGSAAANTEHLKPIGKVGSYQSIKQKKSAQRKNPRMNTMTKTEKCFSVLVKPNVIVPSAHQTNHLSISLPSNAHLQTLKILTQSVKTAIVTIRIELNMKEPL